MLVAVVLFILLLLLLGHGAIALPALIVSAMVIGFWVMVIRLMIGFGRWMFSGFEPQLDSPSRSGHARLGADPVRTCGDTLCRHANPADARYCARCGKRVA